MGCTSSTYIEDTSIPNNRYFRSGNPNHTGSSSHGQIILTVPEPGMIIVPGLDRPPPQYYPDVHAWNPETLWRPHPPEPLPHPDEPELYALEIELIDTAITAQRLAIERARQAIVAIKANKTRQEMALTQRDCQTARDQAQVATNRATAAVDAGNRYRRSTY